MEKTGIRHVNILLRRQLLLEGIIVINQVGLRLGFGLENRDVLHRAGPPPKNVLWEVRSNKVSQ